MINSIFTISSHGYTHCSVFFIRCFAEISWIVSKAFSRHIQLVNLLFCKWRFACSTNKCFVSFRLIGLRMNSINRFVCVLRLNKFINSSSDNHRLKIIWSNTESYICSRIIDTYSYIRT